MKAVNSFLFLSILFFSSNQNSFADAGDSVVVLTVKKVKIGPQEMLPLVDSVLLFKQLVDAGFEKKASEALSFNRYKTLQSLYSLLAETQVYAQPNEITRKSLLDLIDVYRHEGNRNGLILLYNTLAIHSAKQGDNDKSVLFFKEALTIAEALKDKPAMANISQNLSAIYKTQEKYPEALVYAHLNLELNSSLMRANQAGDGYLRIASIKTLQNKYRDAEYYILRKAFPLYRRMGNKTGRMMCFQTLAEMYQSQKKFSEAKWFYVQAGIMADKLNNSAAKVQYVFNLASIKNIQGDVQQALTDYKQAEELAKANRFTSLLIDIKSCLGDIYKKAGNYAFAGTAINEYNELKASYLKTTGGKVY
jgi:tetratricopeptide (TPR) repeat protein